MTGAPPPPARRAAWDAWAARDWPPSVLLGAALVVATVIGIRAYAPGIVFRPLLEETGWPRGQVSLAVTVQTLLNMTALFAVGWLGGKVSPRWIIVLTTVLGSIGIALSGLVTSI